VLSGLVKGNLLHLFSFSASCSKYHLKQTISLSYCCMRLYHVSIQWYGTLAYLVPCGHESLTAADQCFLCLKHYFFPHFMAINMLEMTFTSTFNTFNDFLTPFVDNAHAPKLKSWIRHCEYS